MLMHVVANGYTKLIPQFLLTIENNSGLCKYINKVSPNGSRLYIGLVDPVDTDKGKGAMFPITTFSTFS